MRGLSSPWLAQVLLISLAATGCDHREEDCRAFVTRLNEGVERLETQRLREAAAPEASAAKMRLFSKRAAAHARTLTDLPLRTPALVEQRDRYVGMTRRIAATSRDWADALDALVAARRRGDAAREALAGSLDALEERCEGSTCFELMKVLGRPVPSDTDLPRAIDDLAADVAAVDTDADEVDAAAAKHAHQLRALAAAARDMAAAERAAESAEAALAEAAREEKGRVAAIDGLCAEP